MRDAYVSIDQGRADANIQRVQLCARLMPFCMRRKSLAARAKRPPFIQACCIHALILLGRIFRVVIIPRPLIIIIIA